MTARRACGCIRGERSKAIDFLNWTFPLFRIFGILVRLHWFYPVLILMYVLRGFTEVGPIGMSWYALVMAGLLGTTLLHELGHCLAARAVGGYADQILLWPLGGLAYVGHGGAPRQDIKVAAAGPAVHLPLILGLAGLLFRLRGEWHWEWLNPLEIWYPFWPFGDLFWNNLVVAMLKLQVVLLLFNLLVPAYPLDGGRILTNFLILRHGRERAAAIITIFSVPVGVALLVWGFLQKDLLLGFLAVWILIEAWQIRRLAAMGEIEAHPMFAGGGSEYDPTPERPRRPGPWARWRRRCGQRQARRQAERAAWLHEEVDRILEKVSRQGFGSLAPSERRILEEASRMRRSRD